jgi:hypothetical protein
MSCQVSSALRPGLLLASGLFLHCVCGTASDPLDNWHWRNPLPQGNPLYNVSFCNGTFFALGPQGTFVTSLNGIAWEARALDTPADLYDVAWGLGRYVLVGSGGLVLVSTNGVTWSERPSGTFNDLLAITYGSGTFVAAGDQGTILTSTDGNDWIRRTSGGTVFYDVAWNGSQFMVVGYDDSSPQSQGSIYTSADGVLWTRRHPPFNGRFSGVTVGTGLFVVVGGEGNILSTPDGNIWFSQSSDFYRLQGVTHSSGLFVAVGDSTVYVSSDGLRWTNQNSFPSDSQLGLVGVAFGSDRFVAVGGKGIILSSPAAAQWTNHTSASVNSLLGGFASGDNAYVAVGGNGAILASTDGLRWQQRASGITELLTRVAFGNGLFVAVGAPHRILTSTNALNWTLRDSGLDEVLLDIAYGGGRFVAVGIGGSVLVSTNGSNWARTMAFAVGLNGITWSNGLFLAVGDFGTLMTSPDGTNWTARNMATTQTFSSVAAGNGIYVVVGDFGLILASTNLSQWSSQHIDGSLNLRHVQYAQGRFAIAGFSFNSPANEGHILTSADGITWTFRNVPAIDAPLTAVGVAGGTFFVVGDYGTILQSDPLGELPPVLSLARGVGGCPVLTLTGVGGRSYRIESTTALRSGAVWQSRTNLALGARIGSWVEPQCVSGVARFYRAVVLP